MESNNNNFIMIAIDWHPM